ncbi:MAG: class I SAM-dependent methyltransferase, partial [Acidobacteria bacterium]|nr:class I SAM-dependent methyltransferase [Acidobacteriota bacterium]
SNCWGGRFTIRKPFRSALDLGAGGGVQAMLAARHCREVWAVDQCARAIEFARFNLALNGIANIHLASGDMFEPVAGRRFDLITGNLPFVISPGRRYFYRDSGSHLDAFARRTVSEAARRLEDGGYCHLICQWVEIRGEDWQKRLAEWFDDTGCDAWVLQADSWHPLTYAENWIRDSEPDTPGHAERLFQEWARYYAEAGVASIHTGLIALRRSSGRNWVHIDEISGEIPAAAGDLVLRGFALCDFENTATDEALLATRLRLAPGAVLVSQSRPRDDTWRPIASQIRQAEGWRLAANIDSNAAALLARCDGRRTLSEAIASLAAAAGAPPERIAPACLPLVRHMLRRAFLLPPG